MKKYDFWEIFECDGRNLILKNKTKISGITFNAGNSFDMSLAFAGIVFGKYVGRYLAVEKEKDVYKIVGIF